MLKIGIIREWKQPADKRVVLTPSECEKILKEFPTQVQIKVESSPDRIYSDQEYTEKNIKVADDVSDCDVLMGVKEVPASNLFSNKTYFFFAHVIKKQPHNQLLMKALLDKKITMIDFETITNKEGKRLIGFGEHAGMAGAYNGLLVWGKKNKQFELTPAYKLNSYKDLVEEALSKIDKTHSPFNILVTGTGRVGKGVVRFLNDIGIKQVSKEEYLNKNFSEIVFAQLGSEDIFERKSDGEYDRKEFHSNPELYKSCFLKYAEKTDLLMNGVFWSKEIPILFEKNQISDKSFAISVIADISCDVEGSVPITYKATDIYNPTFGVDKNSLEMTEPFLEKTIDVMAVSNLPTELPKDASEHFGNMFSKYVLPELLNSEHSDILHRATICQQGKLNTPFAYLSDYALK